jgi:small subunit ribosomal protein S10
MVFIQFHLKSFREDLLNQTFFSLEDLQSKVKYKNKSCLIYHQLKKEKKRLTVIRSPHVHKKSREQFGLYSYHSIFTIQVSDINTFLFFLKSCSFYGVQVKMIVENQSFLSV